VSRRASDAYAMIRFWWYSEPYTLNKEVTDSVAPKSSGPSPYLQHPATGPYLEPTGSNLHPQANLLKIHSDPILLGLPSGLFPSGFPTKTLYTHSPWFDLPNNIWGGEQNMNLLIVQLPPFSCHFIPLWSKCSPQNPVLKHPPSMRFL
jgi:hypothetical protein